MKIFRCFLALVLLCGLMGTAKADVLDFQFSIQDPLPVTLTETLVFANTPFAVAFGACQLGEAANGCFYGLNKSTVTLTTLDITFINTIEHHRAARIFSARPSRPTARQAVHGSQFFRAPSHLQGSEPDGKSYDLFFRGTPGIAPDIGLHDWKRSGPIPMRFRAAARLRTRLLNRAPSC